MAKQSSEASLIKWYRSTLSGIVKFLRFIFVGQLKIKGNNIPKAVIAGIVAVVIMYLSVAGLVSVTTPWLLSSDTREHIDYIWRASHNQIPHWNDGLTYPPFVKIYGFKYESASANPPLFYEIQRPFLSSLLKAGKWQKAIAVGRAVNLFIGVLCILALAWAGWLFGGQRAALFSVTVPALTVFFSRFTGLNIDFAVDVLLILFATLALINAHKLITKGLKAKYLIWAAILSVLGMATKASYIVPLAVNLIAVIIAAYLHSDKKTIKKNIYKAVAVCSAILLLVVISTGWFYYNWNYKTTGNWFSASPKGYTGGRIYVPTPLIQFLTRKKLWTLFYSMYTNTALSIAISSFTLAAYLRISKQRYKQALKNRSTLVPLLLLVLMVAGIYATQVVLAKGSGSISFRYMLPALLPFGLYLSYGLLEYDWMRAQSVTIVSLAMAYSSLLAMGLFHRTTIYKNALANSTPTLVPKLLLVIFPVGAILLAGSLYILSSKTYTTGPKTARPS